MDWKIMLSKFAEALIVEVAPFIVALVLPLLLIKIRKAWADMKLSTGAWVEVLEQIASMAVKAAEQSQIAGFIDDKKEYAIQMVEAHLKQRGFDIDLDLIADAIEAAVYEEFTKAKIEQSK